MAFWVLSPVVFHQSCLLFVLKPTLKAFSVLETVCKVGFCSLENTSSTSEFYFTAHARQTQHDKE